MIGAAVVALGMVLPPMIGGAPAFAVAPAGPADPQCDWSVIPSPNASDPNNTLEAVAAVGPSDAWAVGWSMRQDGESFPTNTIIERWDGMDWSLVPSPNPGVDQNALNDIVALAPDDVWAVGTVQGVYPDPSQPLVIRWDGGAWSVFPTPSFPDSVRLFSISARSDDDIWVGGDILDPHAFYGRPFLMHWDGRAWRTFNGARTPGATAWWGLAQFEPTDVWAVGWGWTHGFDGPRVSFTANRAGSAWSRIPSPSPGSSTWLYGVDGTGGDDVWAVGAYQNGTFRTLAMHWDGSAWSLVRTPTARAGADLYDVVTVSATESWAVGDDFDGPAAPLIERWDGVAWTMETAAKGPPGDDILLGVDADPDGTVWAVGESLDTSAGTTSTLIERGC
jgi:hypothetical protein